MVGGWASLQNRGGFMHISVGMDGKLGSAETVHGITCHKGYKADLFNGSSGLEKQRSCKQARNLTAFYDLASEATQ